ncbi:MAG: tetratricopeptide repeat protein [Deltaproteobacteria bacterium]|uniref:Tetratricopeptide repeat protein n=1 Tax=Candidatus Zymogenus saltonus TaxID=2844893 RepID=A0A9D8PNM5_9DELT|nr:tetratricopeptide repeat protein [Candidatus Zymogenus saltonus]
MKRLSAVIILLFVLLGSISAHAQSAEEWIRQGKNYLKDPDSYYCDKSNYEEAFKCFNNAVIADPNLADAYYWRGKVLVCIAVRNKSNSNPGWREYILMATADFDNAIMIEPDYAEAFCFRGSGYHVLENHAKAFADLERACELGCDWACSIVK